MSTTSEMSDNPRQWTRRQVQHLRKQMRERGEKERRLDDDLLVSIMDDGSMRAVWHLDTIPFEMNFVCR